MTQAEKQQLIEFYQRKIADCNDSIEELKNKNTTSQAKKYSEINIRYSEGYKDALNMVIDHLTSSKSEQ